MKTLVLGLGNDLFGDDGVGLLVVRTLKEEFAFSRNSAAGNEGVDFEECCLTGLSLLDVIIGYDALVIIDTIKKPDPLTGRIHVLDGEDLRAIPGPSPHYVSVPQMIEIGRASGVHVPATIKVVAVEAKNVYDLGEGLSPEMRKSIPAVIKKVKEVLIFLKGNN
jgi:hydrogenase maturation protease